MISAIRPGSTTKKDDDGLFWACLHRQLASHDLVPHLESLRPFPSIGFRSQAMPPGYPLGAEVLANRPAGGQESLGMPSRLKAPHGPFSLPGWLVGVLGPIVEIAVLAMPDDWQYRVLGHKDPGPRNCMQIWPSIRCDRRSKRARSMWCRKRSHVDSRSKQVYVELTDDQLHHELESHRAQKIMKSLHIHYLTYLTVRPRNAEHYVPLVATSSRSRSRHG